MTIGLSSLFLKTLSSRGVYIRLSVMVAPHFVPGCITPKCLAHGNEGEATPTTTVGILRPLIYIYMVELSLTDSSLTFVTVGDGSSSFCSRVRYTKLSSTKERRRSYPHDNSRDFSSSHIWWRLSLTDYSSLTFATIGDGRYSSLP